MSEHYVLSYGGGVDSTALLLFLLDNEMPLDEVVYIVMPDLPETHEYVDLIDRWLWKNYGMEVTHLTPHVEGTTSLLEYVIKRRFTPLKAWRWCSDKFKVRVMAKYIREKYGDAIQYVGIDADEKHRAKHQENKYHIRVRYPLVEAGIGRAKAKQIIREHGLPVPPKSGCYICPFMGRERLMAAKKYREIWEQIKLVESFPPDREKAFRFRAEELDAQVPLEVFL